MLVMSGASITRRKGLMQPGSTCSSAITNGTPASINNIYDAIVIGLGGVGSFALRSAAIKNKQIRVLGIERFQLGHELGSSHGDSRLFRHAYFEHPNYVPLCLRSTQIFQELCDWKRAKSTNDGIIPTRSHVPLLEQCGVLMVSDRTSDDGTYEFIQRCLNSAQAHDIPVEMLDSYEMIQRYGNLFDIHDKMRGLLEPGAGFVRPELALQYAIEDAIDNGADIVENSEVVSIEVQSSDCDANTIHVETSTGQRYQTRAVLVSAGAWTSKLLPDWAPHLTVTRQVQAWFEPGDVQKFRPSSSCPGWYLDRTNESLGLYGFPADPLSSHHSKHVKIALHGRDVPFDPDDPRPQVTNGEIDELRDAVKAWIPEALERMVASKACLYTMSPDGDFILDRAPGFGDGGNIWCVAGLSGHVFKMTPALGAAAADLIVDGQTELPVGFLNADRLR